MNPAFERAGITRNRVWACRAAVFRIAACAFFWVLSCGGPVFANAFEDTVRILEDRTVFHWGRDCLVWVVHYPEEIVGPWVESEAGRAGMTESEREAYEKGFVSELSIGEREPFLFTVYAFGPRPLSFAPVSEKVALVTARGERVKPVRYDRTLDQPINRIAQGLIFFPKQRDRNFALSVQGMGIRDERIFSFQAPPSEEARAATEEIVVVELPPAPKSPAENKKPENPPARRQPIKIENPRAALPAPPVPPVSPGPEIAPAEPEESMADFVAAMRSGTRSGRAGDPEEPEQAGDPGNDEAPKQADSQADAYVSREKTVRTFLDQWTSGGQAAMYDMLSASSRKLFSRETFESELRKASDFRSALRDGYTLEWLGPERVKVVAVRRILLIRTLAARTLGVVREDSAWKIAW